MVRVVNSSILQPAGSGDAFSESGGEERGTWRGERMDPEKG
jgi:hypothetical protein